MAPGGCRRRSRPRRRPHHPCWPRRAQDGFYAITRGDAAAAASIGYVGPLARSQLSWYVLCRSLPPQISSSLLIPIPLLLTFACGLRVLQCFFVAGYGDLWSQFKW